MADANELYQTIMRELSDVVISDSGDFTEEQDEFTFHQDTDSDDFPPSLLSYFETSKSRAADCEKFILEGPQDLTASHLTEDVKNLPYNLDEDMMRLNMQVTCETENEEKDSSADIYLSPAHRETEALSAHNVSAWPSSDDEAETDQYMGCEDYFESEERTMKSSMKEEKMKKNSEQRREKQHCEETMKEEQRRQRERDFQEELRRIMETEKLQQKELELRQKRAQEKLEQEFLLQQEMISNLQKRVEEERKMREEEQKRIKEEREKKRKEEKEEKRKRKEEEERKREEEMMKRELERKREEEMMKRDVERKRMEEEKRKREEEEKRKRKEKMMEEEMERKRMEEEKRRREEEKIKKEMERKRVEEESRKMKEEQEKRKLEEITLKEKREKEEKMRMEKEENRKREEEKNKIEEDMKKREEERKIKEIRLKEERRRQVEAEERKRRENDETNREREEEGEETRKKEDEKQMRKKMEGDERGENEEEMGLEAEGADNNDKDRRREEEERTEQEEMGSKEEERKREEETRKVEVEKKRKEEEHREKEEIKLKDQEEKIKQHEERRYVTEGKDMLKKKDENKIKELEMGQKKEEECRDMEKEKSPTKEREWAKAHETENREMERERKTKDEENRQEEVKKLEDVRKIKEDNMRSEERRLRGGGGEEEGHKIIVQDIEEEEEEEEERKRENGMKTENESKNTETRRNSLTSQPEDGSTATSQSPGPNHDIRQHFTSSNSSLPVCLPERTEQKRLSWMKDCVSWSKLSLQNRRKQEGGVQSGRGARKSRRRRRRRGEEEEVEARGLPPLCPHTLLLTTGCTSLQEVTTVTLEDLPGCSLSTLAQCPHLQALTLRRCGLESLEGIKHLAQLCYIDVQENDISFVDCEDMTSLQVLLLGRNKLTSIHGLTGAENLGLLDLSHNSITRIAGLVSMKRLQRLSMGHNQLISTKGLRDVYTLLHLDCSHNHLASVEGLENSALLQTLDLRANSLTEPPTLNNHVLLRELHLDDNSISSLQGLAGCWLPLLHRLSVAHNRITVLSSMADFLSLANLDLQFNCMSEMQDVCASLQGCRFIREVHLSGNPVEQESGWSSTLQQAVAGLRTTDGQETDAFMSAPAVPRVSPASGGFLAFCQTQLKRVRDLQQQHSRELSNASSHLDAVRTSCRHLAEALKLAVDQRFAHEYGDTAESAGRTTPEETLEVDSNNTEERSEAESVENVAPVALDDFSTSEEKSSSAESLRDADAATTTAAMTTAFKHRDLDPKNTAAVVIQQWWRKYRQKCRNISGPPAAERGGEPESGPSSVNNRAASIIQALWRGFALRRRLASALAAVTRPDGREEDQSFEEVDVDEFVLDEATLEKQWMLDSPSRLGQSLSEELLSLKPLEPFPESSQCTLPPLPVWRPKQAWGTGEPVDCTGQRVSPESSNRNNSAASSSALSGLSARSEKILEEWGFTDSHTAQMMLRRAQKMKSKKQQQKKFRDPSVRLAPFRNCSYQKGPAEARHRPAPRSRYHMKVSEAEPELGAGLGQDEETERVTQQRRAQQPDREAESERFLPEISSDILNGGRVQLVADPGYTERLHHASGSWANSNSAALPCKERNYPRRNSPGHARAEERPPPDRVMSAPLNKERISFRDNPVRLSGGWGGGKKRDRVYK